MHPLTVGARRSAQCVLAVAAIGVAIGACGGKAADTAKRTPGVSGDTIYLGALTPLSDAVAVIGKPILGGLTAYFDKV